MRFFRFERQPQQQKQISEPLDTYANRAMAHIGILCLLDGVIVAVDDAVEVRVIDLGHFKELLMVECSLVDKPRQRDRGQVADGDFIGGGVFDDLCAEVAGLDRSQVLLIGFGVAGIFVDHVGSTCLDLRFQDFEPEFLRIHLFCARVPLFHTAGRALRKSSPQQSERPGASLGQK